MTLAAASAMFPTVILALEQAPLDVVAVVVERI
jgi:hypothetical protein